MVGAYPIGQRADVCDDDIKTLPQRLNNIKNTPLPINSPLDDKELLKAWENS